MNVKMLPLGALLFSTLSLAPVGADEGPPSETAAPSTAGVMVPKYQGPRVCDIAPQFTLPKLDGTLWSLRDQLGQRAVLLVLVGESPVLVGEDTTPESVLKSIVESAEKLRHDGVTTVAVARTVGIKLTGMNKQFDLLTLQDDKGDLYKLFNPAPTALTLVAIDRAGFLRRIETARDPAQIGARMRQFGDPTPKLEVGKPAPDFSISDMHGRVRRLADLRGQKNLLLTFFPKCFTGG